MTIFIKGAFNLLEIHTEMKYNGVRIVLQTNQGGIMDGRTEVPRRGMAGRRTGPYFTHCVPGIFLGSLQTTLVLLITLQFLGCIIISISQMGTLRHGEIR